MKKYKYITIFRVGSDELFDKKPIYRIFNNRDLKKNPNAGQLGMIFWYKPWKEYVFSSREDIVFNNTCLRDVLDFIENRIDRNGETIKEEAGFIPETFNVDLLKKIVSGIELRCPYCGTNKIKKWENETGFDCEKCGKDFLTSASKIHFLLKQ